MGDSNLKQNSNGVSKRNGYGHEDEPYVGREFDWSGVKNWNNLADYRTFRKKRETDHSWTAETWAGNDHFADWAAALLLGRDDKQEKNAVLRTGI